MSDTPGVDWIRRVSRLVPRGRREAWRREWEAEVTWGWRRMNEHGRPGLGARLRFTLRTRSCLIDALVARMETMTMTGWTRELKFALRSLTRHPSFALLAILTLALGIGVNTTVFTLVDGVLIRPLPFPDSDQLIALRHEGRGGQDQLPMSDGLYELYGREATTLDAIGLYTSAEVNLMIDGRPERLEIQVATPSFFSLLGVEPELGRTFTEAEGVPAGPAGPDVVILSYGLWRDGFGADPSIVGRSIDINGRMRDVVGVMPDGFGFPEPRARMWMPYEVDPAQAPLASFGAEGVARMTDGATLAGAQADLERMVARLEDYFPEAAPTVEFLRGVSLTPVVRSMKEEVVGDVSTTLWVLLGTVGFVLLIACANVANLLLVRAETRQRELALRMAVGAGRRRILTWFMSESVVLALAGAILGVSIAAVALNVTLRFVPADIPRMNEVGLDLRVLGFTGAITLGCALFFGLFPLTRFGTDDLAGQLREGSRGATDGGSRWSLRNLLVVSQMALALMLLIGSGLMFRSFAALRAVDPGFEPEGIAMAQLSIPSAEMQSWGEVDAFYRALDQRLEALPGVSSATFATALPLVGGAGYFSLSSEDHPRGDDELPVFASHHFVGGGIAQTLGLTLVEGRDLTDGDGAEGTRSVLVNRTFAELWWPDASPLGRRVRISPEEDGWFTIVGVVEDAAYTSLTEAPPETIYWPLTNGSAESPQIQRSVQVVVRTAGDPAQLLPAIRDEVRSLSARTPVSNPTTMTRLMEDATSRTSFTMALLGSASGIALLLGLVGIYGVISYVVSQRTREIGVRLALGAAPSVVRGMVVRQGLALSGAGMALGLIGAFAMRSVMASLLFGVSATDPATYLALAGILLATAVAAAFIPAWRASRVDPAGALRAD